jgi:hypothetical protein
MWNVLRTERLIGRNDRPVQRAVSMRSFLILVFDVAGAETYADPHCDPSF